MSRPAASTGPRERRPWRARPAAVAGLLATLAAGAAQPQQLIANLDVSPQALTKNEARLYFAMHLVRWPDKRPVRVFVLPDKHDLHIAFCQHVLEFFPYQLRTGWDRQVFTGTGQAPTVVADESELIQRVATTPGAIGYASSAPANPNIRSLEVR